MAAKQFSLACNHAQRQWLSRAIRQYAEAAYPPGGSECAQAAREALLNAAHHCDSVREEEVAVVFSRRIRSYLRAAVHYVAEQHPDAELAVELRALLEEL